MYVTSPAPARLVLLARIKSSRGFLKRQGTIRAILSCMSKGFQEPRHNSSNLVLYSSRGFQEVRRNSSTVVVPSVEMYQAELAASRSVLIVPTDRIATTPHRSVEHVPCIVIFVLCLETRPPCLPPTSPCLFLAARHRYLLLLLLLLFATRSAGYPRTATVIIFVSQRGRQPDYLFFQREGIFVRSSNCHQRLP